MVWGTTPNRFNNAFLGMNIKDKHYDKQNESRNDAGKTNPNNH